MNDNYKEEAAEKRLKEYGELLRDSEMPEEAGQTWRTAVRREAVQDKQAEDQAHNGAGQQSTRGWLSSLWHHAPRARYVAAALIAALVLVYSSPTVSLYAGSLPMVGSFFRMIGADRGLQLAADEGVARDVNMEQTVNGVQFELLNVVADTSRTVLGFRITAPENKLQQGAAIQLDITDQWGRRIPRHGAYYRTDHDGDSIILTGYITNDGMVRKTRHLNLHVASIGDVQGPWEFQVPVSYERAVSLEKSYEIGARSQEINGVELEVAEVELHATETVVTYVFHGLNGDGAALHPDSYRGIPRLFTAEGERVMALGSRDIEDHQREDNPLVVRIAYEPLPEKAGELRVVHEAVARRFTDGPHGRVAQVELPSFTYRIAGMGSSRTVDLVSSESLTLWGTTVECTEASLDGNTLTLRIRGTDGQLVELVGISLRDDRERSYSFEQEGFNMESETKLGHIADEGMHFEYTLTYELEEDAEMLTLSFPEVLKQVAGPWEVEFSVPE